MFWQWYFFYLFWSCCWYLCIYVLWYLWKYSNARKRHLFLLGQLSVLTTLSKIYYSIVSFDLFLKTFPDEKLKKNSFLETVGFSSFEKCWSRAMANTPEPENYAVGIFIFIDNSLCKELTYYKHLYLVRPLVQCYCTQLNILIWAYKWDLNIQIANTATFPGDTSMILTLRKKHSPLKGALESWFHIEHPPRFMLSLFGCFREMFLLFLPSA